MGHPVARDMRPQAVQLKRQRGEGILSFMLFLGLLAIIIPIATNSLIKSSALDTARAAAWHQQQIVAAAEPYIKDNYATILANAAAGTVTITTTMLRNAGYLQAAVPDANINRQTYQVLANRVVLAGSPVLQVLMPTVGGTPFSEDEVRKIAALNAGSGGGYISKTDPALVQGYGGSYQVALASFGVAPGPGHVATGLFFNSAGLISDYLYRNAVPGHPELNRMNTAIDMNNNAVNNASTVNTGDLQLRNVVAQGTACTQNGRVAQDGVGNPMACESGAWTYIASLTWVPGVGQRLRMMGANGQNVWVENINGRLRLVNSAYSAELASIDQGGNLVAQGSVNAAGNVSANGSVTAAGNVSANGSVTALGNVLANGTVAAQGDVTAQGQIVTAGRLTTGEYVQVYGVGARGTGCPANGLIGREGDGTLLSCVNGIWAAPGGVITVNGSQCPPGYAPVSYLISTSDQQGLHWSGGDIGYLRVGGGGDAGDGDVLMQIPAAQVKCVQ